jgi:hypothetical protein
MEYSTELTPTEINLLANFSAWAIFSAQSSLRMLFQSTAAATEESPVTGLLQPGAICPLRCSAGGWAAGSAAAPNS